jgi:ribosomal protein S18 acetylase RimI-like enzyme
MEFRFRPAGPGDGPAILEMMRDFYPGAGLTFDPAVAREALAPLLAGEFGRVWVVRAGDEPAGYVVLVFGYSLEFGGRDAFVDELYLRPEYRGLGLGRRALGVVEDACRASGVRALHLVVDPANLRAHALYRRAGFEDRGNRLLTLRLPPAGGGGG